MHGFVGTVGTSGIFCPVAPRAPIFRECFTGIWTSKEGDADTQFCIRGFCPGEQTVLCTGNRNDCKGRFGWRISTP
jgi:hypothetical protein